MFNFYPYNLFENGEIGKKLCMSTLNFSSTLDYLRTKLIASNLRYDTFGFCQCYDSYNYVIMGLVNFTPQVDSNGNLSGTAYISKEKISSNNQIIAMSSESTSTVFKDTQLRFSPDDKYLYITGVFCTFLVINNSTNVYSIDKWYYSTLYQTAYIHSKSHSIYNNYVIGIDISESKIYVSTINTALNNGSNLKNNSMLGTISIINSSLDKTKPSDCRVDENNKRLIVFAGNMLEVYDISNIENLSGQTIEPIQSLQLGNSYEEFYENTNLSRLIFTTSTLLGNAEINGEGELIGIKYKGKNFLLQGNTESNGEGG